MFFDKTWRQTQKLKDKCKERALDCQVTYDWADGQYGLLAMIIGDARYLALTGLNYVPPVAPPLAHPNINGRTSSHNTAVLTIENEEARRNYAIVTGFHKGIGDNICDALDSWYYIQLQHRVFK